MWDFTTNPDKNIALKTFQYIFKTSISIHKKIIWRFYYFPHLFFRPGYTKTVLNEGMPISKSPQEKGNLIITFDIEFPQQLSLEQKSMLQQALL